MSLFNTLSKMATANGRAYLTLLRAEVFALGLVGAAARISAAERALKVLVSKRATDTLCELLERASLPGQLYALLGLSAAGYSGIEALLANYRHRTEEVRTQTACFISSQSIRVIVARIEDGTYCGLLRHNTNAS